jgi:hypothetical protein
VRSKLFKFAAMLAFSFAAHGESNDQLREFTFAETKIEAFSLEAVTRVEWAGQYPNVDEIFCRGENGDIRILVGSLGQIETIGFEFTGPPNEEGEREQITRLDDQLWLWVDGKRYEFRKVSTPGQSFKNITYPPYEQDGEIILIWRGSQMVRSSNDDPMMHISRLYGEFLRAKKLEWSFKARDPDRSSDDLPKGWEKRHFSINNKGLSKAVDWCSQQVASVAARTFPQNTNAEK